MDLPADGIVGRNTGDGRRRCFNQRERSALYLAAGGRCVDCGAVLGPGWHADHRVPWSRGGPTSLVGDGVGPVLGNGAALCPACNGRKGARSRGDPSPASSPLVFPPEYERGGGSRG